MAQLNRADGAPRILFVAHWDWVLQHFRLPVARAFADRGAHVVMVCPEGNYVSELTAGGFDWVRWRLDRRSLNLGAEFWSLLRLVAIYRKQRPDAVFHFTAKPNLYGSIASCLTRVPAGFNVFSGLGFLFSDSVRARALRVACVPVFRLLSRSRRLWTIVQNEADRRQLVSTGVASGDRCILIAGSGVDLRRFVPAADHNRVSPVVLMASRLIEQKGVRDWVAAARAIKERGIDARFWLVGEPDEGNPSSLHLDEVRSWENDGVIEYLGHRNDVAELLRKVDIAVLPSYYGEGVPRFLLEAIASGLPVIGTTIPGCDLVVHDGWNGYLVPPRDRDALCAALVKLIANRKIRRQFGERSRQLAEQEFDESLVVSAYLDAYSLAVEHA